MRTLIADVRTAFPFDSDEARRCSGTCNGCSKKLLDYLELELEDWEERLDRGETPGLNDLSRLIRTAKKIYPVLQRNGLLGSSTQDTDSS